MALNSGKVLEAPKKLISNPCDSNDLKINAFWSKAMGFCKKNIHIYNFKH